MIKEAKNEIWKNYQKEIADDKYFYVRSCVRQNFFPGAETTFLRILKEVLRKDVYEHPCHTTCTGVGYHSDIVPVDTTMTVVARQFALMTQSGYKNLVPSCITSFGLYTEIIHTWQHHPEILEKTRENLFKATGRSFEIPENLSHASDIIYKFRKELAAKAKHRLVDKKTGKALKIVEHIGCHYAKMFPDKGVGGAEYPQVLSGLVDEWGGEIIDYPERRHCCGFGFRQFLVKANRGYSLSASKKKFESMQAYEPDAIITNCPGCPMFLDRWQYTLSEIEGKVYGKNGRGIPVLTFEELTGIVLGFDPWDMGLQMHQVAVEPFLDKIGLEYDANKKYDGPGGKKIGRPLKSTYNI